jgi:hypothetical protein
MDRLDLSGRWLLRHDPQSVGLQDRWWRGEPGPAWTPGVVPAAWQATLGLAANGLAWYRRPLPPEAARWVSEGWNVRLSFASVATDCRVWIGDTEVGRHVGDWVPFEFDITEALRRSDAPASLTIRVDQFHAPRPAPGVVVEHGHITKGFHDVLSVQHAGLWGDVALRRTGPCTVVPNGFWIDADPDRRDATLRAALTAPPEGTTGVFTVVDPHGERVAQGELRPGASSELAALVRFDTPVDRWSPDSPALYEAIVRLRDAGGRECETLRQRFGFRTIAVGGGDRSRVLLNGRPLFIRGMLYWGHEPAHLAPAPTEDEIREEFRTLRAMGFNAACLCMYYPPERFYDVADQTGMLLWQEHPVWKSRMTPDLMPEYRRLFTEFLRRDRRHPSVVIVSATCEHEAFDEGLSRWWWETGAGMLPRTLRQVQTGFLEWTPPDRTDLYDDHVYDNHGRWLCFLEDMTSRIRELPPRPFVMGETIISNGWPDLPAFRAAHPEAGPWYLSRGLKECGEVERQIAAAGGSAALDRFRRHAHTFGVEFRKFQMECVREHAPMAGFVTNSIRDVPICRLGYKDDLGRWRFTPADFAGTLSDTACLFIPPDHALALRGGEPAACRVGVSNFGPRPIDGELSIALDGAEMARVPLHAEPGEIVFSPVTLTPPASVGLRVTAVSAALEGVARNTWRLAVLPESVPTQEACVEEAFGGDPPPREFEERGYSSGWGLPSRTWQPLERQSPDRLPGTRFRTGDAPAGLAVAHTMTPALAGWIEGGGRCVFLTSRHAGPLASRYVNLWGQVPWIVEGAAPWPIREGESDAILAMLPLDLTRRTIRAVPVQERGLAARVAPIVRYVYTHDSGVPNLLDAAFAARLGRGLLVVSAFDHTTPAGRFMLTRLLAFAREGDVPEGSALSRADVL